MRMEERIKELMKTNVPILIWGPPGVGKTATITHLANELNLPIEVVIASIREPSDFNGLPVVDGGDVIFAPPKLGEKILEFFQRQFIKQKGGETP